MTVGGVLTDRSQRAWARVAGLMFWLVLVVDISGTQVHSRVLGRWLALSGALLTVPLAVGLYYAVKPAQPLIAATALSFRLLEAGLGIVSTLPGSNVGSATLRLAHWNDETSFAAFSFTIGSTLFFYLFVKAGSIPRTLAWLGLVGSLAAMAPCLTHLVRPEFPAMTIYAWIPLLLAETSTGLWLLFKSVRTGPTLDM